MTPTPTQIAEYREKFEQPTINATPMLAILLYQREHDCEYSNNYVESEWQGYLRARTEQASEIAGLKAKLADAVDALKKYDDLIKHNYSGTQEAMSDLTYAAQNGHSVLLKLVKD
jgi:hypothetical protein